MRNPLGSDRTMICRSLDYYLLVMCFVVTIPQRYTTELLPPPFNLSYEWIDPFYIRLTWQAHPFNSNCSNLKYELQQLGPEKKRTIPQCHTKILVEGLNFTLKTTQSSKTAQCPYGDSNTVSIVIPRQVLLVTDFKFFLYPLCDGPSSQTPFCGQQATWTPGNGTSGLKVSYGLCQKEFTKLSPCQVFNSGGLRQGCHLNQKEIHRKVCILFQGTVDGRAVNQTFVAKPHDHIRTFQPKVSVSKQGGRLNISWQHAIVCAKNNWNYVVNYSECGHPAKVVTSGEGEDHLLVPFDKACRYEVWVQPRLLDSCGFAQADSSALLVYNEGATQDHSMMVACVAVPSLLSVLVVAACCYVRRKRNTFFKKIPVPPSSLKEMMSSIHQSQQLFVPVREEVDFCSVSPAPPELHTLMWEVP